MTAASNPAAELTEAERDDLWEAVGHFATNSPEAHPGVPHIAEAMAVVQPAVERILAARLAAGGAATDDGPSVKQCGICARLGHTSDEHSGALTAENLTPIVAAPAPTEDAAAENRRAFIETAQEIGTMLAPAVSRAADTAAEEPRTEAQIKAEALREAADDAAREAAYGAGWWSEWLRDRAESEGAAEGCDDCVELCSMGPTCPGGMLAGLDGSGCWRTEDRTHGSNHAPLPDGARLAPGFCAGCDAEADRLSRADEEAGS